MLRVSMIVLWWTVRGAVPASAVAGEIPLSVDWAGVDLARPYPVTGGVPFGRGELVGAEKVRLRHVGDTDRVGSVPLQTRVLAWWPGGSVKWLLLDFLEKPTGGPLVLEYGAGLPPKRPGSPPLARELDGWLPL